MELIYCQCICYLNHMPMFSYNQMMNSIICSIYAGIKTLTLNDNNYNCYIQCILTLRAGGHEVYLVGGTVRDLLLGREPKDYDILTSASRERVRQLFEGSSVIVGRKFPIVQVTIDEKVLEVSSFDTNGNELLPPCDTA